jgi:hypothetical protein
MSDQPDEFTFIDATNDLWVGVEADGDDIDWSREEALREVVGEQVEVSADSMEANDEAVLGSVIAGFRARAGREAERQAEVTMADCYVCVCFATRAQREAFLQATRWIILGRRYIDGREVASRMGIDLPPDPEWPQTKRSDATWDDWAMTVQENRALPE